MKNFYKMVKIMTQLILRQNSENRQESCVSLESPDLPKLSDSPFSSESPDLTNNVQIKKVESNSSLDVATLNATSNNSLITD